MRPRGPTYDLSLLQVKVRSGDYVITSVALTGAMELELDRYDIADCVLRLDDGDFYKTMPSDQRPGLMQDVYKPTYEGRRIYLKLQISRVDQAVVISFKKNEDI